MKHNLLSVCLILFGWGCAVYASAAIPENCDSIREANSYPDHYCSCEYEIKPASGITNLKDVNFSDSIWFKTTLKTFTNAGMTAYLFSESDVQVDIYQNCRTTKKLYSFTVPENQTRDLDHETILAKLEQNGVDPGSTNMTIRVVFYPVVSGADCRLMCYPYNTGPNSTPEDPLPVLVGMSYVSSYAYDVYELKAENIPASCALYTQWKEANNLTCNLTVTRGSVDGEVVAEHEFLNSSTYFRFDPNLLAEVRESGESLYMHYDHDASAAGRIITREATLKEEVTDLTLCQGKGLEAYGTVYTTPDTVTYNRAWVGTSLKVSEYKYNLTFTEPALQYDTLRVHVSDLPMLYRGQYTIPASGACDFDCLIHRDDECDEHYLLHVIRENDDYVTVCHGESYDWNGTTYTESGSYTKTLQSAYGCDSIVTLHLTILPESAVTEEEMTVCGSEGYVWDATGETYTTAGDYEAVLKDVNGCDSVVILHLNVLPAEDVVTNQTICKGESWVWDVTGEAYGTIVKQTTFDSKSDKINPTAVSKEGITIEISGGATGNYYDVAANNTLTISSAVGAISHIEITCTGSGTSTYGPGNLNCADGTYTVNDYVGTWTGNAERIVFTALKKRVRAYKIVITYVDETVVEGTVSVPRTNDYGCEVNYILNWKLQDCSVPECEDQVVEYTVDTCGTSYLWKPELEYTESGVYYDSLTTALGCDSVEILYLTLNKPVATEETVTACDSYLWNDSTYTASGDYTYTTTAKNGCDSVVTLHLTINKTQYAEETVTACDSYLWNDSTYTASGDYTYTTTAKNGCDSVVTLHLTINKTQYAEETVTACDSYTWNDSTYTASGDYTYTTTAKNGCDSVVTLHLTINKTQYAEETVTACDSYLWNDSTYTASGDYTYTTTAKNGCDSVVTLHMTINKTRYAEETVTACDSYTWNGETYATSGNYTYTTTAKNGCDSIVTLHLTINQSSVASDNYATICYGETLPWNGGAYAATGDYTITLSNAAGCDSVVTLHLTVLPKAVSDTLVAVVGSDKLPYMWRGNGYSETGLYTIVEPYTTIDCDSAIHVLDLTVLIADMLDEQRVTICETELPYKWYGQALNQSGKYSYVEQYVGTDIDSIQHVLTLTVNPTVYSTEKASICEGEAFTWNGVAYTEAGEYTATLNSVLTGCDSIVTLFLTVNPIVETQEVVTACDAYVWTDGSTYTESGVYTQTLETIHGCDSIVTLHLTINHSSAASDAYATICYGESLSWNGGTYAATGDYTITLSNVAGCDSVVTLHLTVLPEATTETEMLTIGADDTPYMWYGESYTASGEYTYVERYATTDCDSVIHVLYLTVLPSATVEEEQVAVCESELPYTWYEYSCTESGNYVHSESYAGTDMDSVIYMLTLEIYKTSLPSSVTLPVVRVGEPIDVSVPNAEIQAYIDAETWYAPNSFISWYLKKEGEWADLTDEPVAASARELIMKYAVDSDCGRMESEDMTVTIVATSVDDAVTGEAVTVKKVILHDKVFIIRGDKMYSLMGIEVK